MSPPLGVGSDWSGNKLTPPAPTGGAEHGVRSPKAAGVAFALVSVALARCFSRALKWQTNSITRTRFALTARKYSGERLLSTEKIEGAAKSADVFSH